VTQVKRYITAGFRAMSADDFQREVSEGGHEDARARIAHPGSI
jgi:hypothetical protein